MQLNLLHINPIAALVYSALIKGLVAVPLLVLILLVANNRTVIGIHTTGWLANAVGILTTLAMAAALVVLFLKRHYLASSRPAEVHLATMRR
jgi:Mn2+/Fe2+ NRAMP family transporter